MGFVLVWRRVSIRSWLRIKFIVFIFIFWSFILELFILSKINKLSSAITGSINPYLVLVGCQCIAVMVLVHKLSCWWFLVCVWMNCTLVRCRRQNFRLLFFQLTHRWPEWRYWLPLCNEFRWRRSPLKRPLFLSTFTKHRCISTITTLVAWTRVYLLLLWSP